MNTILSKIAIPVIAAIICGFGGYAAGVYQVSNRPLEIKTEAPKDKSEEILKSIDKKLADLQNANAINIDKMKGFKGTFQVSQSYHIQMNGDSLVIKAIGKEVEGIVSGLKLARCK